VDVELGMVESDDNGKNGKSVADIEVVKVSHYTVVSANSFI
jgi:hypothetical protein